MIDGPRERQRRRSAAAARPAVGRSRRRRLSTDRAWLSSRGIRARPRARRCRRRRSGRCRRRGRACRRRRSPRRARSSASMPSHSREDALRSRRASRPGLRTCMSLSSHSSVTSSSPSPLTSMPPPSSTMRSPRVGAARLDARQAGDAGRSRGRRRASRCQLSYFAQPLNAQLTSVDAAVGGVDAGRRRVAQPDAVGRRRRAAARRSRV